MKIHGYIISMPDDLPVIGDALDSLTHFCDAIFLVDGGLGSGTLCHYPQDIEPLYRALYKTYENRFSHAFTPRRYTAKATLLGESYKADWGSIPLFLWENPFQSPAAQRNWILGKMLEMPDQPDWIVWIDTDEVCSWEMIKGIRKFLQAIPPNITNIIPQWLNLVQDEQHCVGGHHSTWLAHGRIHKPGLVSWVGSWHEHGAFEGDRMQWDVRIIHTRALYRRRLLVQRGHPVIKGKSKVLPNAPQFWDDALPEPVSDNVTWPKLNYPEGEIIPFPFEGDAAKVWDHRTGEQIGRIEDSVK